MLLCSKRSLSYTIVSLSLLFQQRLPIRLNNQILLLQKDSSQVGVSPFFLELVIVKIH